MHNAWVINDYSGFEGLSLEQFPDEEPGPGEVRLRIEAFALNWATGRSLTDPEMIALALGDTPHN